MNLIKESFLATLRTMRDAELKTWDNENNHELHELRTVVDDAKKELGQYTSISDSESAARDFIEAIDNWEGTLEARKEIEIRWGKVISYAEANL